MKTTWKTFEESIR